MRSAIRASTLVVTVAMLLTACAPAAPPSPTTAPEKPTQAAPPAAPAAEPAPAAPAIAAPKAGPATEAFDLEALVAAAKKEGELVVYWHSSRIDRASKNFEAKYGIKVKGTKMNAAEQTERVVREVDSKNVQVDSVGYEDGPLLESKLIPEGYLESWLPPDLASQIVENSRNPVIYQWQPRMFGYNTEIYGNQCPISNVWQLTEPKLRGKVLLKDLDSTPAQVDFFSSLVTTQVKPLEQAYQELYGKPVQTSEENAGWEFLKQLFRNDVVLMNADGDIGDAVGAAGQKEPPIGLYTLTKHRDAVEKNLKIATCNGLKPWVGYGLPTYALVVKGAPHPNAAKLWVHYVLTPEGVVPWTVEDMGGFSSNPNAAVNPYNEGTWSDWAKRLVFSDNKTAISLRQKLLDFWLVNKAR